MIAWVGLSGPAAAQTIFPLKLNGGLVIGGSVQDFQISPDGSRVVYRADQDTVSARELYSVPIAGGPVASKGCFSCCPVRYVCTEQSKFGGGSFHDPKCATLK